MRYFNFGFLFFLVFFGAAIVVTSCGHKLPLTLALSHVPGPPENLAAVQRKGEVLLSWVYGHGKMIKGFLVMRKTGILPFKKAAFVTGAVYSDRIVFGDFYTYQVRAEGTSGVPGKPAFISLPALVPPPPPKGLRFAIGSSSLTLRWTAEGKWHGRPVFYNVYGGVAGSSAGPALLNPAPLADGSFSLIPAPGEKMIYSVKALLGGPHVYEGRGASAIVRPLDFVPSRPAGLEAASVPGGIILLWRPNPETWVSGYKIYRGKRKTPKMIGFSPVPSFFDKGARSGTYRVGAVGSVAQSPLSETATLP